MEQPLLPKTEDRTWASTTLVEELKKVSCMAAPMVVVMVSLYLLQVVSLMMAGHLGELSLSAVSIGGSFATVTGFSLLFGLTGGLETLCGQAYGAEQYQKLGTYTYCAIISLIPICIPVSILWIFMDRILIEIGQDPEISTVACQYAICLIPALFAYAVLQSLLRYFQSMNLILPMLLSTSVTLFFHIPLCWALIFKWKLGIKGAALAIDVSYWLNVIFLGLYMGFSSSCKKTRVVNWNDIFSSIKEFFCFALPSAVMVCLEWWTFELLILLAGLLPNSQLETSVLSICCVHEKTILNYKSVCACSGSAQVSNKLGAGNHEAVQVVIRAVLKISLIEAVIVSTNLFFCRNVFGYAFSSERVVVDYVNELAPLLCLSIVADSLQTVLSGIARGCGWQHIGAYINLGAYYLVGIPVAVLLCFILHLRGKGLWIGILTGNIVQATLLALITGLTDWEKQATKARERIFEGTVSDDNGLP
uniref:Protein DETOXIFICATION n=1 Tax=Populus alba TaxID=43335 RepID=A0A4U5PTE3_POPAL|nr:MATE efflux family protein 7-like [Populus alba]